MRSKINKISITLILVFAFTTIGMAAETIAVVLKIKGKVSIARGAQANSFTLK